MPIFMRIANLRGGLVEQVTSQQVSRYLNTVILDSGKRVTEVRQGVRVNSGVAAPVAGC